MTDKPISPLRQRMIEDMTARHFAEKAQTDYIRYVKNFAAFLGRSPDTASAEDLRLFQQHMTKTHVSPGVINATVVALRFFFKVTLERDDLVRRLTLVREPRRAPTVLSPEEVARLLEAASGAKYKAALGVAYGAGLRVSEVVALKVSDIDNKRMLLRVEQGKGQKDRFVMLSPQLLELLRERVLTKDSPENRSFFGEGVKVVVEVVVDPQRQIDHFDDLGDDFRAAAEPCEKVADVAVVLFDGDGQVFAGEELVIRDEAVIALPIIGDERLAFEADFVEELLACGVITATKNPGDGSPSNRVIGSPKPQFLSLFFTKCHISSRVTTTTSALVDGSGSLRASSRTQFRTATSLTPRMRAMEPKLTLPMA